ncbi:MAG TPA: PH domain-containing protein [Dehalococcoidia bacterium]|nr:PH domain-containing protein [Dehalococcoidia bacterium]
MPQLLRELLSRLHDLFYYDDYLPYTALPGEQIVLRGSACNSKSAQGWGNWGNVVLTNKRLLWAQSSRAWPFKRSRLEIDLSGVEVVNRGVWLAGIFGGRRLAVRLRTGKTHRLWIRQTDDDSDNKRNTLKVWEQAISQAIASAERHSRVEL